MFLVWSTVFFPVGGCLSLAEPALVVVMHSCSLLSISYSLWHFSEDNWIQKTILFVTLITAMSSGSPEHSTSQAELLVIDFCPKWWGVVASVSSVLKALPYFPPQAYFWYSYIRLLCNTTYLGYFSCSLFWLGIFVIKNIKASWLHPISILFPSSLPLYS